MTDYTSILPAEPQILLSSCTGGPTPNDVAYIEIDEDGDVSLSSRTLYGGDAVPMAVHERRVLWFELAAGTDAEWLREQLAGGEVADLLDTIIASHSVAWNGFNNVGRFDADALYRLEALLQAAPTSDLHVVDAREWLQGDQSVLEVARFIREHGDTPETLLEAAESDRTVVIDGGLDAMSYAMQELLDEADIEQAQELLDGWDDEEADEAEVARLFEAVFDRELDADDDSPVSHIFAAINVLDADAARRVIKVLK